MTDKLLALDRGVGKKNQKDDRLRGAIPRSANVVSGVTLSHPDRVLFSEQSVTKLALARYYESISEWIIPHVEDRPLDACSLPGGIQPGVLLSKHANDRIPEAVGRVDIPEDDGTASYMVAGFAGCAGGAGSNGRVGAAYVGGRSGITRQSGPHDPRSRPRSRGRVVCRH